MYATNTNHLVGIGISNPHDAKLTVKSLSKSYENGVAGTKVDPQLRLEQNDPTGNSDADDFARISFENAQNSDQWVLAGNPSGADNGRFHLDFYDFDGGQKSTVFTALSNGHIGIGETAPDKALVVNGHARINMNLDVQSDATVDGDLFQNGDIKGDRSTGVLSIYANQSTTDGPYMRVYGNGHGNNPGSVTLVSAAGGEGVKFYNRDSEGDAHLNMIVKNNGNVGIGVSEPENRLEVCGTIRAKEVRVETGWCDYVFEEDFELRSLEEVEQFIKENKHLPDIPPASVIESEGVKLAEIASKFMLKIEELTLYTLAQKKEIDALKEKVVEIENE